MKKGLFLFVMLLFALNASGQKSKGDSTALEGVIKFNSGENLEAITIFTKAIGELNLNTDSISLMLVYSFRGEAKWNLGDNRGAILDLSQSINFANERTIDSFSGAKNILAGNYSQRGHLKELLNYSYQEVIKDYDKAIQLNPYEGKYFAARGYAKHKNGQKESGCLDLSKGGELGLSLAYEMIKELCN
jgi:tetratricopeptide (TPR) repeat protein